MSSPKYAAPLTLDFKPSRRLGVFLLAVHASALAVLPPLAMPWWIRAALALAIAGHLLTSLHFHVLLKHRDAIVKAVWDTDDRWWLTTRGGKKIEARVAPGSYVQPWLVVVHLAEAQGKKRRHLLALPDNVPASVHRQLRVRLRITTPD